MNKTGDHSEWKLIKTEPGPDLTLFRIRFDWMENPRNGYTLKATVVEAPDWINVVALTPENKLVVVRQYRFGSGRVTCEIPAGLPEAGESIQEAAVRELREETGYTSEEWEYLGWVDPNPAFLNNRSHHLLARNARRTHPEALDEGENLVAEELSLEELREEIRAGSFRHSLAICALAHVFDLRELLAGSEEP
jgi:ADP-ribose pyrophosphatase